MLFVLRIMQQSNTSVNVSWMTIVLSVLSLSFYLYTWKLALENGLRYFPEHLHSTLATEFAEELRYYGHIYMYRFAPEMEMRYVEEFDYVYFQEVFDVFFCPWTCDIDIVSSWHINKLQLELEGHILINN